MFAALGLCMACTPTARAQVTSWPAPAGEKMSDGIELVVAGQKIPVYACRVSAVLFNQVWPGYQRPLDQTETAAFAYWDMAGPARIEIRSAQAVQSVTVRPAALGIAPSVSGNRIVFELPRPRPVVVEINGSHHALHLFASPPEKEKPAESQPGVRYFGPGVHRPGTILLRSGETVYISGGAVVHGSIQAHGARNIRVLGRGIIDCSDFERGKGGGCIRLADCRDIRIEGVVMRDPDVWCCTLLGCTSAEIANVKLIGLWRYNSDGIDLCNSQSITIHDCFARSFDDSLVLKGLKSRGGSFDTRPVRDVRASGCVIWNDWGRAFEIGAETCAPEISHVIFEDCDVIHATHIAMDIQHGDRALVSDIAFRNIRVEIDNVNPRPLMQERREDRYPVSPTSDYCPKLVEIVIRRNFYSQDSERGNVRDILFKDISVMGRVAPPSNLHGFDAQYTVQGVTFQNVRFAKRPILDAAAMKLTVGPYVQDIRFAPPGGKEESRELTRQAPGR